MRGWIAIVLFCFLAQTHWQHLSADEPVVKFDVPALSCVREIASADTSSQSYVSDEKLIEIVVPVSAQVRPQDRDNITEIRVDVFWNRTAYPMADYGPKSQTTSEIEGFVSVEKTNESKSGISLGINGKYEIVSGTLKGELYNRKSTVRRYDEIPEHDVLVASGSTKRGTGAFFRFHPSRRDSLEGGRELVLAYRVPHNWRSGILKVECRASGSRKVLGAWNDEFSEERAFIVPVHLDGDSMARDLALQLVQAESDLKSDWRVFRATNSQNKPRFRMFGPTPNSNDRVPDLWVHYLIQSGKDDYFEAYQRQLPVQVKNSAQHFVASRSQLLELNQPGLR